MTIRPLLLLLLALSTLTALPTVAQPQPFGCHFFHGQQAPMRPLSAAQRSAIEATIARSDTFDILHYEIAIDVTDVANQFIRAATTITFKALHNGVGTITFDLLSLTVDSVIGAGGEELSFTHDGEYLVVSLDPAPMADEERMITVHYRGNPVRDPQWGGFYFASGYVYNLGIGISTIPPHFGKVWYPCFDSFVERATYTYHVKSAGNYRLHGQGTFLGEVQLGGDTVIRSSTLQQAIPTHVSAIAVSNYQVHEAEHQGLNGPIPITLAAKPNQLNAMVQRFQDLGEAIDVCEHWYGPYGYERVGYVLTTAGALEIPTNVAYPEFMTSQSIARNRGLLTHELGHHWWGDVVTPYIHNDMWLKEGPAEYSSHLVEEWIAGQAGLEKAVKDNLLFVLRQAHVNDDGYQPLSPMPDPYIYGTHTYYKGAAVMHNLRGYLGDELFRLAMRTLQEDYANTTLSAEGFRNALELATGADLHAFFDDQVFAPGWSVFEVVDHQSTAAGDSWNVDLTIAQKLLAAPAHHTQVPLDLTFISSTGQVHETAITASGALTALTVPSPFEPAMVVLNRNARLNQARLDYEFVAVPGEPFSTVLPWVDFRIIPDAIVDSTRIRVEHLWVAADQQPLGFGVLQVSGTHYWNVDGLWPEGTDLRSRINYTGGQPTQLDHALIAGNESGLCIVWRARPGDPWEVFPQQTITTGSLTDGNGFIDLFQLRKGQYALAKFQGAISVSEEEYPPFPALGVFPVPANEQITVEGGHDGPATVILDIIDLEGRIVRRETLPVNGGFRHTLDTQALPSGGYILRAMTTLGNDVGAKRFEVVH